ncbi:MAG: SIR2 family protein [Microthrixaceae bacterium]
MRPCGIDNTGGTDAHDLITRYGRYVDEGAATALIGAGMSRRVGYPGWVKLLEPMRTELGIGDIDEMPLLAQYFVDASPDGRARLDQHVIDEFNAVGDPDPALACRLLAQLPIGEFWTTNFDPLLERSIGDAHVFANDAELASAHVEPGGRRVNKMHGSIDPPGPFVLTRDDYDLYATTHPRFWQLLQAQFLTKTFLFLGFSFTDPNLELVFRLARTHTADIPREHFAIMKKPDDSGDLRRDAKAMRAFELKIDDFEKAGVQVVVVDSYDDIDEILGKLVARCRPPQLMISGSTPTTTPRVAAATGAYPTDPIPDEISRMATAVGARLADTGISAVAGGAVGALVGYEMCRALEAAEQYDASRFTLVRRRKDADVDPPNLRLGNIVFTGDAPTDLRSAALQRVRALLVLGGSGGTQTEIDQAVDVGLGVVPLGCTGGTAEAHWQHMRADLGSHRLGGRRIDPDAFELLASGKPDEAANAAVHLVIQALYLD